MREAHPLERSVGMAYYASDADGTGGRLRAAPGEFRVTERERFDTRPADADPDDYPYLVVRATLREWDTNEFAGRLSNALGMSRERVDWAGTKDRNAVTTQLFSLRGTDPGDLPALTGADLTVVGRAGRGLVFGDLAGNEFRVTVRDADRPAQVAPVTADLRAFGGRAGATDREADDAPGGPVAVPNYFGQQRFGSYRAITHEVGLRVVRREWEAAVLAYAGNPSEHEPEGTREARRYVEETRDWAGAVERFPGHLRYERAMLHSLAETGGEEAGDFRAALESLPSNLQSLFVNAAQSYAFNLVLSRRLAAGLPFHEAVEGDVVCFADRDAPAGLALPDPDRSQRVTGDRVGTVNRHCARGRAFVTAPLVGTDTGLAGGEPGAIEREVLADLDLAHADFDLPGEFGSTGTRRAILVRTDLGVERDGGDLAFEFALPKGSYATVLLREYLKTSPLSMS